MILLDPQLVAFESIVRAGTVHGAAKLLCLTQTAVTQRLRMLEQKMKTTLFIRSRRGMLLTAEGEALHRYCQRVLEMEGAVLAQIQGSGVANDIRVKIAGPSSIMRSRIIPQCEPVLKKLPYLTMTFVIDDSPDLCQTLKSGNCDLAILCPEYIAANMDRKGLATEHYVLVCSSQWKNRPLADILAHERIIDFDPADTMTFSYLKHFNLLAGARLERHFVNNTESIVQLFMAGFGYGVLTKEFAEPYIKAKKLQVLNQNQSYENANSLAWYPRPEMPLYFSSLIHAIN